MFNKKFKVSENVWTLLLMNKFQITAPDPKNYYIDSIKNCYEIAEKTEILVNTGIKYVHISKYNIFSIDKNNYLHTVNTSIPSRKNVKKVISLYIDGNLYSNSDLIIKTIKDIYLCDDLDTSVVIVDVDNNTFVTRWDGGIFDTCSKIVELVKISAKYNHLFVTNTASIKHKDHLKQTIVKLNYKSHNIKKFEHDIIDGTCVLLENNQSGYLDIIDNVIDYIRVYDFLFWIDINNHLYCKEWNITNNHFTKLLTMKSHIYVLSLNGDLHKFKHNRFTNGYEFSHIKSKHVYDFKVGNRLLFVIK